MKGSVGLFYCIVAAILVCESAGHDPSIPLVSVSQGQARGSWMTSQNGRRFAAFRGIPYALPPVGQLRFQVPAPMKSASICRFLFFSFLYLYFKIEVTILLSPLSYRVNLVSWLKITLVYLRQIAQKDKILMELTINIFLLKKDPLPASTWDGVLDASHEGPKCIQFDPVVGSILGQEDCLMVNVYTADVTQLQRPIPIDWCNSLID